MARPPEPEKRRELARRATRVLEREGLEISAARLAEALGIKRPTLLYHFPTYGHLLEVALEDLLVEQSAFVLSAIAEHEHPIERLYAQLRAVHAFHEGREARVVFLTQAIAASAGKRLPEILAAGTRVFEAHRRDAADRVRKGIAEGTVAPCDADALVTLVRAMIDGLLLSRVTSGVELPPVHALVWERVFAPLILSKPAKTASTSPRRRSK